jgi:hypothetical protein
MLVTDDTGATIWRISYTGRQKISGCVVAKFDLGSESTNNGAGSGTQYSLTVPETELQQIRMRCFGWIPILGLCKTGCTDHCNAR